MTLAADLRTALRSLRRTPGFALFATLALAAGIGLTVYMFGAINAFVLRPLPYRDADRLMHVELADPTLDRASIEVPYPDFVAWRDEVSTTSDLAAYYHGTLNLADGGDPERLDGVFVTGELFEVLGVGAQLGRTLMPADARPGAPGAVVLSHVVWQRRYGGEASIVGRAVRVNGRPATIVGVMPEGFRFPLRTEAWSTIADSVAARPWADAMSVEVLGHLRPGAGAEALGAELDASLARLRQADTSRPAGWQAVVKPFAEEYVGAETRRELTLMFVAVVLVLGIACANVANLLYARGVGRQRDLAVRAALGASRRRLIVLGLVEAVVVALVASAIGLFAAQRAGRWTMEALRASEDMVIPSWVVFETDARGIAFTLTAALVAALAAGLAPALAGSRPDVQKELRVAGRGGELRSRRALRVLVVSQIALGCALVTCAGLAAKSIALLGRAELGVDGERILGGRIAMFEEQFPEIDDVTAFYARAEERLRQLPGVVAATVTTSLPGTFIGAARIEIEGGDAGARPPFANVARVAPGYFDAMDLALESGRGFAAADDAGSERVAIVNRRFADRLFAGEDPIGRRIRFVTDSGDAPWARIVGVAPDVHQDSIDEGVFPTFYLPIAQDPPRFAFLAVRTERPAAAYKETLRKAVAELDPDQPLYYLRTLDEWVAQVRWSNRFMAGLFVVFAGAGLALAAIGVYGMAAYAVARRTGEIGLRRALGARDRAVVGLVASRSARDLAWGLGIGLVLALALARPVAGMFYGVEPFDPATFAVVPLVLAAAIGLATLIPARRALGVEPAAALRNE